SSSNSLAARAGECSFMKWRPGQEAETVRFDGREYLALDVACQQVVDRLFTREAEQVAFRSRLLRLHNVPCREVAASEVQDFPLGYRNLRCLPDLVPRGASVNVMKLIQIDVVCL